MSKTTIKNRITFTHPAVRDWVFSQMPVSISGAKAGSQAVIMVESSEDGTSISETRAVSSDGSVFIDISRMAQLVMPKRVPKVGTYDSEANTPNAVKAVITLIAVSQQGSPTSVSETLTLIYGAMDVEETVGGARVTPSRFYWYEGRSCTLPIHAGIESVNGQHWEDVSWGRGLDAWCDYDIRYFTEDVAHAGVIITPGETITMEGVPTSAFAPALGAEPVEVVEKCAPSEDAVFLRWLSRKGYTQHIMLAISIRQRTSAVYDQQQLVMQTDERYISMEDSLPTAWNASKLPSLSVTAGLDNADEYDFALVADMLQPPRVEMELVNNVFMPVQVGGSLSWSDPKGARKQHLEVVITSAPRRVVEI